MNNENQNLFRLINRLIAKFHSPQILKRVATLCITIPILITSVSCGNQENTSTGTTTDQNYETNINGDKTHTEQNESSSDTNLSQYSQLLQNVLNNQHYNQLIDDALNINSQMFNRGEFKPHPYAFLKNEGFDIESIQNGDLDCFTLSYVQEDSPNDLYMYTRVIDGNTVSNYLLKYNLTEQEMDDYNLTHYPNGTSARFYIQSVFMNNEISKLKTPTIVGSSKMTVDAFEEMTESLSGMYVSTSSSHVIMINPNDETKTFSLVIVPEYRSKDKVTYFNDIVLMNCSGAMHIQNGLFDGPRLFSEIRINEIENIDATLYISQQADLSYTSCKQLS